MLARGTLADVVVIALIGERGREVREFLERDLAEEGRRKSVHRRRDERPTCIAANLGRQDSHRHRRVLSRYGQECAVADGLGHSLCHGPTRSRPGCWRSSNHSRLSAERVRHVAPVGRTSRPESARKYHRNLYRAGGRDDPNEPISDALRGLLDGHVHLSRSIAGRGRYPAIDVLPSLSRLQSQIVDAQQSKAASDLRRMMAVYRENEDLINIGAYQKGSNAEIDRAIELRAQIETLLAQPQHTPIPFDQTKQELIRLASQVK